MRLASVGDTQRAFVAGGEVRLNEVVKGLRRALGAEGSQIERIRFELCKVLAVEVARNHVRLAFRLGLALSFAPHLVVETTANLAVLCGRTVSGSTAPQIGVRAE